MRTRAAAFLLLIVGCVCPVAADAPAAVLVGDSAMVPMRAVFEWLNASVTYAGGRITAVRGEDSVSLTVGSRRASVNGRAFLLATSPTLRDGTTYVPLRFVAESMRAEVEYDKPGRKVVIRDAGRSLGIPIVESDPVKIAIEVFRQYMMKAEEAEEGYRRYRGRTPAFVNPSDHGWLREGLFCSQSQSRCRPVMEDTKWPLENARFRQLLRDLGWEEGDPWFVYDVDRPSPDRRVAVFEEWNWWTSVHVSRSAGLWRAVAVEADGEGNEGAPPLKWTVTKSGATYSFKKIR